MTTATITTRPKKKVAKQARTLKRLVSTSKKSPKTAAPAATEANLEKSAEVAGRILAARKLQKMSMRELARRSGMSHSRLHRIENDPERPILLIDLIRVSEALKIPTDRLLNGSPVRDRVLAAARAGTVESADGSIDSIIDILELEDQLNEIGLPGRQKRSFPVLPRGASSPKEWGKNSAQEIRALWDLPSGPLTQLAQLIEKKTGIYVTIDDMLDGVDGLSLSDPEHGTALIAASTTRLWERQRFTLAHELGHMIAGQMKVESFADVSRGNDEKAADEFARNLLLPWADVASKNFQREGRPWHVHDVAQLAWEYQVSPAVAAIQLSRAGFAPDRLVTEVSQIPAESWSLIGGWEQERESVIAGAQTSRKPSGILRRIIRGWSDGTVPLGVLTRLTNLPEDLWLKAFDELKMLPKEN